MQRFALRFLLPAEILLGLFTLSWGLAGAFGSGRFTSMIATMDNNYAWAWCLSIAGSFQIAVAVIELQLGRDWSDAWLCRSADLRHFAAFLGMLAWLMVIGVLILYEPLRYSLAITLQTIVLLASNAIICVHSKRLSVLLDPNVQTTQLRERLVRERVIRG